MLNKLSSIVLYILCAATIVVAGLFYFAGEQPSTVATVDTEPIFTEGLIFLIYSFIAIAALIVVIAQGIQFGAKAVAEPKKALKSIGGIALLAILLVVTYFLSSGEEIQILGSEEVISSTWSRLVDMQLYSTYVLAAIGLVLMAFGGLAKNIK